MQAHERTHKDLLVNLGIFILGFSVLLLLFFDTKRSLTTIQLPRLQEATRKYESKEMHLSLEMSNRFQIIEDSNSITIHHQDGDIFVKRLQTKRQSMEEFIQDFTDNNPFSLSKREQFTIDNFSAMKGLLDGDLYYFIYTGDQFVYAFSTSSTNLFDDLDQIIQSFHYLSS